MNLESLIQNFIADGGKFNCGFYNNWKNGHCALEVYSHFRYPDRLPTDRPADVSKAIGGFIRAAQDSCKNDEERTRVYGPILHLLQDTRGSDRLEMRRAFYFLDWHIRTLAPAFLRLAQFHDQAVQISSFPEISNLASLKNVKSDWLKIGWELNLKLRDEKISDSMAYLAVGSAAYSAAFSAIYWASNTLVNWGDHFDTRSMIYWAARIAAQSQSSNQLPQFFQPTVQEVQTSIVELIKRLCVLSESDLDPAWNWE